MPHLNNKQSKNTNPNSSRQDYHLTQPWPTEEKQKTNKQTKQNQKTAKTSPYKKITSASALRRAEAKKKKEFNPEVWEKETSNTIS